MVSIHYETISNQLAISDIIDLQDHVMAQPTHSWQQNKINKGQQGQIQPDGKYVQKHFLLHDQHGLTDILEYIISFDHAQSRACD